MLFTLQYFLYPTILENLVLGILMSLKESNYFAIRQDYWVYKKDKVDTLFYIFKSLQLEYNLSESLEVGGTWKIFISATFTLFIVLWTHMACIVCDFLIYSWCFSHQLGHCGSWNGNWYGRIDITPILGARWKMNLDKVVGVVLDQVATLLIELFIFQVWWLICNWLLHLLSLEKQGC